MRLLLLYFFTVLLTFNSAAQPVAHNLKRVGAKKVSSLDSNGWKHSGIFTININQAALSNWSSGGEKFLLGINGVLNKSIHHRYGKYTLDSYLDIELGIVDAASFKKFRKTNDRFDMTVEFEHSLGKKHYNYGVLFNFNSQLFEGHNYSSPNQPKISSFLSPGKFLLSPGIDYKNYNSTSYFSFFISPATIRWVTKIDPDFFLSKKFGIDSARKVNTEMGAYLSIHYNTQFTKTVKLISRLDLFSNYKRKPGNVDVLFNNLLTFNISKNFAGSILLDIIYDDDIKRRTQVQEILGIGVKFNL